MRIYKHTCSCICTRILRVEAQGLVFKFESSKYCWFSKENSNRKRYKENSHSKPFLKKTLTANPSSSTSSSSSSYIIIVIHHHRHHHHHRQSRVGCHCHVRRWRATVPLAALGPERPLLLSLPAPLLCSGPPEGTSPGTR